MKKVCVVLVTFNRYKYLEKLLEALKYQTNKIDTIIIVDNHGTDKTKEMLKSRGIIKTEVVEDDKLYKNINEDINYYYYYSSVNTGGSGGFNKGFSIFNSISKDFDYLWVMDDDVLPEKDCLENLIAQINDNIGLCLPNRTDNKFKDYAVTELNMKNPFRVYMQKKKKQYKLEKNTYRIADMPFEGPLIKANIVKKVGLPDKDYFIFYDDTDYCHRCLKHTNGVFVTNAILHKQIIPNENKSKRMNWRHYYSYRNAIYFDKTYGENWFVRNLSTKLLIFELCLKNILLFRFYNLKILKLAYKDAKRNKRGKTIEPGTI